MLYLRSFNHFILISLALLGLSVSSASAAILYGAEFSGNGFYSIDTNNGSHTTIAASLGHNSPGLAYDGINGNMYLTSLSGLFSIDVTTGNTSFIGSHGLDLTGLTHSSNSSTLYSRSFFGDEFYSVDTGTGAATLIGSLGVGNGGFNIIDFATNSSGDVYGMGLAGDLYQVNTATGAASLLGAVDGLTSGFGITAIAFDENDILYGIHTVPDELVTIDIAALTSSTIGGDIGSDVRGMAFAFDASPVPVPAAVYLFGTALIGLVGFGKRKSRIAA